jgi:hypothetical protein
MHYKTLNAFFSSLHSGFIKVCKTFKTGLGWAFKVESWTLEHVKIHKPKEGNLCIWNQIGSSTCHRFTYNSNNLDLRRTHHLLLKMYFMINNKVYINMTKTLGLLGRNLIHSWLHQVMVSQLCEWIVPTNKLWLKSSWRKSLNPCKDLFQCCMINSNIIWFLFFWVLVVSFSFVHNLNFKWKMENVNSFSSFKFQFCLQWCKEGPIWTPFITYIFVVKTQNNF